MNLNGAPLVTVVTPSFNQAEFVRETLLSVQGQEYPNVEHVVVDGSSTDGTIDVLREFETRYGISWISEPDLGQSHAINKGFNLANGEILGWLNSDDTYLPGAIEAAVHRLASSPSIAWVHGDGYAIDAKGTGIAELKPGQVADRDLILNGMIIVQPTLFFRRHVLQEIGGLSEDIHTTLDEEFCLRLALRYPGDYIQRFQATRRSHESAKTATMSEQFCIDSLRSVERFFARRELPPSIVKLRREAYANRYATCASRMFAAGQYAQSRTYVLKSIRHDPRPWRRRFLIGILLLLQAILRVQWFRPGRKRRIAAKRFRAQHGKLRYRWAGKGRPRFTIIELEA